jgi:hypothetical protein
VVVYNSVMSEPSAETASRFVPDWPTCRTPDVDCTGRQLENFERCLAHLPEDDLDAFLTGVRPGTSFDLRGTTLTADLLQRLLAQTVEDPAVANSPRHAGEADFSFCTFPGEAMFADTRFAGKAKFYHAQFEGPAGFHRARFDANAGFTGARFAGPGRFADAQAGGIAQYEGMTAFLDAHFASSADFLEAQFESPAVFDNAQFVGSVDFRRARFGKVAEFVAARFDQWAWFTRLPQLVVTRDHGFGG